MLKLLIDAAVLALIAWAVWYLVRHLRRQLKGRQGCGCGDCTGCPGCGRGGPVKRG